MHLITICRNCMYYNEEEWGESCESEKAPFTNFVEGEKDPYHINTDGNCEFFMKKKEFYCPTCGDILERKS